MEFSRIHQQRAFGLAPKIVFLSKMWTAGFLLLAFVALFSPPASAAGLSFRCAKVYSEINSFSTESQEWGFQVDQIQVTGGHDYSLKDVLSSLRLSSEWLQEKSQKQRPVVSLAEGTSDLLPYLLSQKLDAYGTDLWYFSPQLSNSKTPKFMKDFVAKWSPRLFASDARDLTLASESVGTVLSHKLFNNLHMADSMKILTEVIRVLEVGCEARLADFSAYAFQTIGPFLKKNYDPAVAFDYRNELLVIQKRKTTIGRAAPLIPFDRNFRYQGIPNGTRTFELPFAEGQAP